MVSSGVKSKGLVIRPYATGDAAALAQLWPADRLPEAPTAGGCEQARLEEQRAPLSLCDPNVWVAESEGQVVAVLGIGSIRSDIAEVRLLGRGEQLVGSFLGQLLEMALSYCRRAGCLKVVLTTPFDGTLIAAVAKRCGFSLNRARRTRQGNQLEFYVNLYFRRRRSRPR